MCKEDSRTPLNRPHMGAYEIDLVSNALKSDCLTIGPYIKEFEDRLSNLLNQNTIVCSSGTAALHLVLTDLVGPGDEVIVPDISFVATINAVLYCGATPVVCDVGDPDYILSINPNKIEELITAKTRAIMVTHLLGSCGNIYELVRIARSHNLHLIEDSAQALGSTYEGEALGTFGTTGILSFNGNKIVTCGGGGAITSLDPDMLFRSRIKLNQAKDPDIPFSYLGVGYNYRLSNIHAAIGIGQLEKLAKFILRKREVYELYLNSGLNVIKHNNSSNCWMTACKVKTFAFSIYKKLLQNNIESMPLYMPFHILNHTCFYASEIPRVGDKLNDKVLCLPSDISITDKQIKEVIDAVTKFDN